MYRFVESWHQIHTCIVLKIQLITWVFADKRELVVRMRGGLTLNEVITEVVHESCLYA